MIPPLPETSDPRETPRLPSKPSSRLPGKSQIAGGQQSMDRGRAAEVAEMMQGIRAAFAQTKANNRMEKYRRTARERAIAYAMQKQSNNPLKAAKRFVRH